MRCSHCWVQLHVADKTAFMKSFLRFWSCSMALSTNRQHYRKMLYFPIGPQQTQFLVDPISGMPPPFPFPVSDLLDAVCRVLPTWHCEGLSTASSRDGRRGRWEVCPCSARSRGVTLCFARPPAARAGNRSPARAAPSSRAEGPYTCKRVIFLFCRQLVWTHLPGHLPDFLSAGRGACSFHPDPATAAGTLAHCSALSLKSV